MHFNTCIAGASIESMFHLHILPHVWRGSTDVRHEKKSLRLKGHMRCIFLLQRFRPPVLKFLVLGFPWIKFFWRVFFELWSSVVPPLILCPYGQCISWKFMFFSRAMHFEEITSVFFHCYQTHSWKLLFSSVEDSLPWWQLVWSSAVEEALMGPSWWCAARLTR